MRMSIIPALLALACLAPAQEALPPIAGGEAKGGREQAKAAAEKAFTDADKSADGKLDRAEFEAAVTVLAAARAERAKAAGKEAPPAATKEQLDAAFAKGDGDKDALLSKDEFGEAQKALRPKRQGDKAPESAPAPAPAK